MPNKQGIPSLGARIAPSLPSQTAPLPPGLPQGKHNSPPGTAARPPPPQGAPPLSASGSRGRWDSRPQSEVWFLVALLCI